jgi:hypothetical protein
VPRPLITKWCLDDSPAPAAAGLRETSRSSAAEISVPGASAGSGRAISLIPLTEDAAAENFLITTAPGSGEAAVTAETFSPLRLELKDNNNVEEEQKVEPVPLIKAKFATQQFEDFVDFSSF